MSYNSLRGYVVAAGNHFDFKSDDVEYKSGKLSVHYELQVSPDEVIKDGELLKFIIERRSQLGWLKKCNFTLDLLGSDLILDLSYYDKNNVLVGDSITFNVVIGNERNFIAGG